MPGLVEPLTGRKLEVLGMLAVSTPNQRIAEELVITFNTVKKHVSHVPGELGAANRTEAIARARELGLISWRSAGLRSGGTFVPELRRGKIPPIRYTFG